MKVIILMLLLIITACTTKQVVNAFLPDQYQQGDIEKFDRHVLKWDIEEW